MEAIYRAKIDRERKAVELLKQYNLTPEDRNYLVILTLVKDLLRKGE